MNIVFLSRFFHPHIGGVEKHVLNLSLELQKKGHDITIVTWRFKQSLPISSEYKKIRIIRLNVLNDLSKINIWWQIICYRRIFFNADVIHIHDVFWWIIPIYILIKNKIFLTFHGYETVFPILEKAKWQRYLYAKLSKATIHVGDYIQNFYYDKPNIVTYGAVNVKRKNNNQVIDKNYFQKTFAPTKKIKFCFIGRLDKDTNVDDFIDFIKSLKISDFKIEVIFVGDGELKESASEIGIVTGFVKDISKYVSQCDFVFATSYLSILEAQSYKKIVLSTYSNDLKKQYLELMPTSKYMLISKNYQSLIKKFELLLENPKIILEMEDSAYDVVKQMSWSKLSDEYENLWSNNI